MPKNLTQGHLDRTGDLLAHLDNDIRQAAEGVAVGFEIVVRIDKGHALKGSDSGGSDRR